MFKNTMDKNSREYLEYKVKTARNSLLIVIVFTVVNIILLLTEANRYFLFSAAVPYFFTAFGMGMDIGMGVEGIGTFTITALVLAAIILGLYLLCWLLAKKRPGWYIAAAVLFALDTVAMVLLNMEYLTESIMDIVFHAWVLIELFQAASANKKLKHMPLEVVDAEGNVIEQQPVAAAPAADVEPWDRKDIE